MVMKIQNGHFLSGIRRIFNCWNSDYSINMKSKLRCFHTTLQGAPNINHRSVFVGSLVAGNKYQVLAYKSFMQFVQNESRVLYSGSTSALEEEKTHSLTGPLTKLQTQDLIMRLTAEERTALLTALQEFQSEKRKAKYEGNNLLCKKEFISCRLFIVFHLFGVVKVRTVN
jgi:hypothetical protein